MTDTFACTVNLFTRMQPTKICRLPFPQLLKLVARGEDRVNACLKFVTA